jgi:hypothetical protein
VRTTLTEDEVRAHLALRLDRARRPDRISLIDTVPLTKNGKPDRGAVRLLVEPPGPPRADAAPPGPPSTPAPPIAEPTQTRTRHEPVAV